jgi:hypothetical protein
MRVFISILQLLGVMLGIQYDVCYVLCGVCCAMCNECFYLLHENIRLNDSAHCVTWALLTPRTLRQASTPPRCRGTVVWLLPRTA